MRQVKTMKEAVDVRTNYARCTTEHSIAGPKKWIEATNQLTHEAMAAITERRATLAATSMLVG
jgi:hypothetical protein